LLSVTIELISSELLPRSGSGFTSSPACCAGFAVCVGPSDQTHPGSICWELYFPIFSTSKNSFSAHASRSRFC